MLVASWHAAYRGLMPQDVIESRTVEVREGQVRTWLADERPRLRVLVAEEEGHVCGFASIGPSRDPDLDHERVGELYAIYLHPDAWG